MSKKHEKYYVPEGSYWPIIACIALFITAIGGALCFHKSPYGFSILGIGLIMTFYMMYGWFGDVVCESMQGLYSKQMDRSFRWTMGWFIFSEVMFFAAFFGALIYARVFSIQWLGGFGDKAVTHMLWPEFEAEWPLLINPDPIKYPSPKYAMGPLWVPTINTAILLLSGVTLTIAHHALLEGRRHQLNVFLGATIGLGFIFMIFQAYEYYHAYVDLGLTLSSGIYGTTFFMLTGFHGLHVTIGAIALAVILARTMKGHFTPEDHFGFEATAWYWHFVDVVWLLLFVLVYGILDSFLSFFY